MDLLFVGLYGVAFFWTLLLTALIGNVIADSLISTPAGVNYGMFTTVFSWIAVIVGLIGCFTAIIPEIALLALTGVATFFVFIAGIVFAARLGVHSCTNLVYLSTNDMIVGSVNMTKRCQELQASTAFFWFLLATYVAIIAIRFLRARTNGLSTRSGTTGVSMSQV